MLTTIKTIFTKISTKIYNFYKKTQKLCYSYVENTIFDVFISNNYIFFCLFNFVLIFNIYVIYHYIYIPYIGPFISGLFFKKPPENGGSTGGEKEKKKKKKIQESFKSNFFTIKLSELLIFVSQFIDKKLTTNEIIKLFQDTNSQSLNFFVFHFLKYKKSEFLSQEVLNIAIINDSLVYSGMPLVKNISLNTIELQKIDEFFQSFDLFPFINHHLVNKEDVIADFLLKFISGLNIMMQNKSPEFGTFFNTMNQKFDKIVRSFIESFFLKHDQVSLKDETERLRAVISICFGYLPIKKQEDLLNLIIKHNNIDLIFITDKITKIFKEDLNGSELKIYLAYNLYSKINSLVKINKKNLLKILTDFENYLNENRRSPNLDEVETRFLTIGNLCESQIQVVLKLCGPLLKLDLNPNTLILESSKYINELKILKKEAINLSLIYYEMLSLDTTDTRPIFESIQLFKASIDNLNSNLQNAIKLDVSFLNVEICSKYAETTNLHIFLENIKVNTNEDESKDDESKNT